MSENYQQRSAPFHKRIDDPWIALIVLSIFILVATIIAIITLCIFWRKHKQRTLFNNESYTLNSKPDQLQNQNYSTRPKKYEVQSVEVYVPDGGVPDRDLGEIHARFTPREGIQNVHHLRPMDENTRDRIKAYL
ncbi:unnamed protein product [Didymodactylos carnosus]|uniref:Uncharacterized protein n=1 Tax=Didymodactylos carnosus TaxID=1234261 RepID=A0A814WRG4_9BILA|nr:unnamed protein product [Didymodactylos carnosus]CAF3966310.1 unnamed protein product [Didymodactylos carnosus]